MLTIARYILIFVMPLIAYVVWRLNPSSLDNMSFAPIIWLFGFCLTSSFYVLHKMSDCADVKMVSSQQYKKLHAIVEDSTKRIRASLFQTVVYFFVILSMYFMKDLILKQYLMIVAGLLVGLGLSNLIRMIQWNAEIQLFINRSKEVVEKEKRKKDLLDKINHQ